MDKRFDTFFTKLRERKSSTTVFNPYSDEKLLLNLRHYFEYVLKNGDSSPLLIGEAPGYKGCRITGIPFTSSEMIKSSTHDVFVQLRSKLSFSEISGENTATIIWDKISTLGPFPIFWNSFPFHPHKAGNPNSNRCPDSLELNEGKEYLDLLIKIIRPSKIFAVGRSAEKSLNSFFPDVPSFYIRHPSYGGKTAFIDGIKANRIQGWKF